MRENNPRVLALQAHCSLRQGVQRLAEGAVVKAAASKSRTCALTAVAVMFYFSSNITPLSGLEMLNSEDGNDMVL
jgi:hypothetical protein